MQKNCLVLGLVLAGLCTWMAGGLKADDGETETSLQFEKQQLTNQFFSEGANFADFNRDGVMDIVSGPFWYAGPEYKSTYMIYETEPFEPKGYSANFLCYTYDINGDEWADVVVVGFPGDKSWWYENPQKENARWQEHVIHPVVDNESPLLGDITDDGKPELIFHTDGRYGYAEPNWENPAEPWTFNAISEQVAGGRFEHGLGIGDVNGDGRTDFLTKDGWLEQPESLEGDPLWTYHRFHISNAASQIYAYDFDGDGDNDIVAAQNAHGYGLTWHENIGNENGEVQFESHQIMGEKPEENKYGVAFSQLHSMSLVDMNGDDVKDLVTGKRWWAHGGHDPGGNDPAVLYWFETRRLDGGGVEFVPHKIDDDSGVGTQVVTGDVNGDALPDIVVGNKKGTFVFTHVAK